MVITQSFNTALIVEIDLEKDIELLQKLIRKSNFSRLDFSQVQLSIPAYEVIIQALKTNFILIEVIFPKGCPAMFQMLKNDIMERNIAFKKIKKSALRVIERFKERLFLKAWVRQDQFSDDEKRAEQLGYRASSSWRSWFSLSAYRYYGAYLVGRLEYQQNLKSSDRYFAQLLSEFKPEFEKQQHKREEKRLGPLNKSESTKLFEKIIKQLLRNEKFLFSQDDRGEFWLKVNNELHNLTELLDTVYYQHIELDTQDLELYLNIESLVLAPTDEVFKERDTQEKYINLHYAHKVAINIYGWQSGNINGLMRNNLQVLGLNQNELKRNIIRCAVIASGLNKIKDTENIFFTFRGEDVFCQKDYDSRIELCKNGEISHYKQFIGTSLTPTTNFHYKAQQIIFLNLRAKDVSGLTSSPHEQEYLMHATPVLWLKSRMDMNSDRTYFLAMPVESLDDYEDWCTNKHVPVVHTLSRFRK